MSLKTTIDANIKSAMLAKDADRLRTLRAIKSLILLEETKEGANSPLTADDELKILIKAQKQRKDSAEVFEQQGRTDLLEKERIEMAIIEEYLPKQLSEDELKTALQAILKQIGATSPADIGKAMGAANKELAGKADGKTIAALVKVLLAN